MRKEPNLFFASSLIVLPLVPLRMSDCSLYSDKQKAHRIGYVYLPIALIFSCANDGNYLAVLYFSTAILSIMPFEGRQALLSIRNKRVRHNRRVLSLMPPPTPQPPPVTVHMPCDP